MEIKIDDINIKREVIWGAPLIADFMGLSVDAVRDLAKDPESPVFKPGDRYCAFRSEIVRWMRTKPAA